MWATKKARHVAVVPRMYDTHICTCSPICTVPSTESFKKGVLRYLSAGSTFLQANPCAMAKMKVEYWTNCSPLISKLSKKKLNASVLEDPVRDRFFILSTFLPYRVVQLNCD